MHMRFFKISNSFLSIINIKNLFIKNVSSVKKIEVKLAQDELLTSMPFFHVFP